jgi:hypothetical protein
MYTAQRQKKKLRAVDLSQRPSQSIKCLGDDRPLNVITPDGIFFVPEFERPLLGEEKVWHYRNSGS